MAGDMIFSFQLINIKAKVSVFIHKVYLYSVLFVVLHTRGARALITQFYLQLHQCLPLPRKRSPDGASPDWLRCGHLIAAYYSFIYPERMKGWSSRPGWLTYSYVYPHKWSPVSCRSSAGQGKFAGQRPTFYHCTTQPINCVNNSLSSILCSDF